MVETALILCGAFALGWLCSMVSGVVFAWIVFRTKRESHERFLPAQPRKSKGPIVIDEFATEVARDDDTGLPDIIKQMNSKMAADLARGGLKAVKNG